MAQTGRFHSRCKRNRLDIHVPIDIAGIPRLPGYHVALHRSIGDAALQAGDSEGIGTSSTPTPKKMAARSSAVSGPRRPQGHARRAADTSGQETPEGGLTPSKRSRGISSSQDTNSHPSRMYRENAQSSKDRRTSALIEAQSVFSILDVQPPNPRKLCG